VVRLLVGVALLVISSAAFAADPTEIKVGYLRHVQPRITISLIQTPPENDGLAGAQAAIDDNNTTGRFLNQRFALEDVRIGEKDDPVAAATAMVERGTTLIVADLPADALVKVADAVRPRGAIVFNAGAIDDRLREEECRTNVFHTAPTRSMLADGLAQYLAWKQWRRWLLVVGSHPADKLYADALRRAARRFGLRIVQERVFEDTGGARRTDSGVVQVQRQMPVFTQDAPEHDVVLVADESDVFGEYLPYQTWDPRPVAGTQGLVPTAWHRAHEQWGGTQMQTRFEKHAGRWMRERDYTAWLGVRALGEAVTRTSSNDPKALRGYLRGEEFELGAFKGEGLTFRSWNQQMRQPILLASPRILVSVSPQEGFLHQRTPLDSLGFDEPESNCRLE
jgi:ABC transporter substrate binding protein (PQQ-dependent alcohol dehydrogenase system)